MVGRGWEAVIIGGGPVGLLLANLLGRAGIETLIVERRPRGPDASMAIGITPPSLHILSALDLDRDFIDQGVRISQAEVHGDQQLLGALSFASLPQPYPFILSLPQAMTVQILEQRLSRWPSVCLRRELELTSLGEQGIPGRVLLTDGNSGQVEEHHAPFLLGCDGGQSTLRQLARIDIQEQIYPQTFLMADFSDRICNDAVARLYFTAAGSVESFPLPEDKRRWIVQTGRLVSAPAADTLCRMVGQRTGVGLDPADRLWESSFIIKRQQASRYVAGPVVLCGDAAHLMSPVGGQGMNVGFADAAWLSAAITAILRRGENRAALLRQYQFARRRAARIASKRAARGMWLGTRRGKQTGRWRDPLIRFLLAPPLRFLLPPYFAMLSLPHNPPPVTA